MKIGLVPNIPRLILEPNTDPRKDQISYNGPLEKPETSLMKMKMTALR